MTAHNALDQAPLEAIFNEIQKALDARLYYVAVAVTLSIPDLCVSLECPPSAIWTNQSKFVHWADKYVAPKYKNLTGLDVYHLRCGVVHNGKFGHKNSPYDRIVLTVRVSPSNSSSYFTAHDSIAYNIGGLPDRVLHLDSVMFCESIIVAAREWLSDPQVNLADVSANMPNIKRLRPEMLPWVNFPVIA